MSSQAARQSVAAARDELSLFLRKCRSPQIRSMRDFAEQEIILPKGPHEGELFSCDNQPWTRHWFDAIDSGRFNRFAHLGVIQGGKSLSAFVIPVLYHLFEQNETVILGAPTMETLEDKWYEELLPVIEASRYAALLPSSGRGSRGGFDETVRFRHGATLKFMSGGSSDKKAGKKIVSFTARIVVLTEVDDFGGGTESDKTDPITLFERRTNAYGDSKRIYMECVVTTEQGRMWQEYQRGTESRLLLRCPHCRAHVDPQREDLVGWQDAADEVAAKTNSAFYCSDCGEQWTESDRFRANLDGRLLHRGQSIDRRGRIKGGVPNTYTLGFRWTCAHNQFVTAGDVGLAEFSARLNKASDEEAGDKDLRQNYWVLPHKPAELDLVPLDARVVAGRLKGTPAGHLAAGDWWTCGVDLGKRVGWWLAAAWPSMTVAAYGSFEIWSEQMGVDWLIALRAALADLREQLDGGLRLPDGTLVKPRRVGVDSRYGYGHYGSAAVATILHEFGAHRRTSCWLPIRGVGVSQERRQAYRAPRKDKGVKIGKHWHLIREKEKRVYTLVLDSDEWKGWIHDRLTTPLGESGALGFYHSHDPLEHQQLAYHLTAEKQVEEFVPGKGLVRRWVQIRKANHWLDCSHIAAAMANEQGFLLDGQAGEKPAGRAFSGPRRRRSPKSKRSNFALSGGGRRWDS